MSKLQKRGIWGLLLVSTLLFLYPDLKQIWMQKTAENDSFSDEAFYQEMVSYNDRLRENGQELEDCWTVEQEVLTGEENGSEKVQIPIDSKAIGKLEIPAIEVAVPLYLGATEENMSKGAAVLEQSSMPVGGESTNCVIAGHRGYGGLPFFRRIDELKTGDCVRIVNSREVLEYEVTQREIILPTDLNCLEIQEGRDLVTLISCHPYMGGGKFRYMVRCTRSGTLTEALTESAEDTVMLSQQILENPQIQEELQEMEIDLPFTFRWEREIRQFLFGMFALVWICLLFEHFFSRRNRKSQKTERDKGREEK